MANQGWGAIGLTGGGAGDLDDIKHSALLNGDFCIVAILSTGKTYHYTWDEDSASAESSPDVIRPVSTISGGDNGRWLLNEDYHEDLTTGIHGVGAGAIVGTTLTQTLTNKTLTTPTIGDFTNATHDHADAAGGGNTLLVPTIADLTNAQHDHSDAANGGAVDSSAISLDIISEGNSNVEVIDAGTGQIDFDLDGSNFARLTAAAGLVVGSDTDLVNTLGRAQIGYDGGSSDYATFAHIDQMTINNYGFNQKNDGATSMNTPTGGTLYFRVNNSSKMTIDANGIRGTGSARIANFLDEDDMVSNSATDGVTQQSVKAYVDNTVAAAGGFGLGDMRRSKITWKDADEIYLDGAAYKVKDYSVTWVAQLTKAFSGMDGSSWYYIYLDYSALSDLGTVTATEVIYSTTAPTWSTTYSQWMNGDDRCIFAVKSTGAAAIKEFHHQGDFVLYAVAVNDRAQADLDTTWTDVTLTAPAFVNQADCTMWTQFQTAGDNAQLSWRTNGQTGAGGHIIGHSTSNDYANYGSGVRVHTDDSQIIELRHSSSDDAEAGLYTDGWYLPIGM
jgi:hypothetical protein